jgi:hypothetical protein
MTPIKMLHYRSCEQSLQVIFEVTLTMIDVEIYVYFIPVDRRLYVFHGHFLYINGELAETEAIKEKVVERGVMKS